MKDGSIHSESQRNGKVRLFELFAEVGKALSSPSRLELIDLLSQAPHTVEDLADKAHMSLANTSQHLQRLKSAGLVTTQRSSNYIRYSLAHHAVARLWLEQRAVGEQQIAEVGQALEAYRPHRHEFSTISPEALEQMLRKEEAVLLDVRPHDEYEAAHLPEAISIPFTELANRIHELPKDRKIVTYCRGPYCVYADQALEIIARHGLSGARLEEGVNEWMALGRGVQGSNV